MPKCTFSGEEIKPGTGLMYVFADGRVVYFKDSKAKKNYIKLGRNPRTTRWTNSFAAEKRKTATTKSAAADKQGEQ